MRLDSGNCTGGTTSMKFIAKTKKNIDVSSGMNRSESLPRIGATICSRTPSTPASRAFCSLPGITVARRKPATNSPASRNVSANMTSVMNVTWNSIPPTLKLKSGANSSRWVTSGTWKPGAAARFIASP